MSLIEPMSNPRVEMIIIFNGDGEEDQIIREREKEQFRFRSCRDQIWNWIRNEGK